MEFQKLAAIALDPIHVGTGEFQLGRVDNAIVREPGSGIPKIPGTSIAGVTRAYVAMEDLPGGGTRYRCAGKGGSEGNDHCGRATCPVCVLFGFSKGQDKTSFQGLATITDARILLFPVWSVTGPRWVTSPATLAAAGALEDDAVEKWERALKAEDGYHVWLQESAGEPVVQLGWMSFAPIPNPEKLQEPDLKLGALKASIAGKRIAMVHEDVLRALVNDNLEVRTMVSIRPETGTAEPRGLFTAEAIPRTTVFWFEAFVQRSKYFRADGDRINLLRDGLFATLFGGLKQMEWMGVGGMGTRGFGRLRVEKAGWATLVTWDE
jgi:CRISPR-associated protein Cmr4